MTSLLSSPSASAWRLGFAAALLAVSMPSQAVALRVLSAGAVEPGMRPALAAFERESGHTVAISFRPAPELRSALREPAVADVVVVPQALLDEAAGASAVPRVQRAQIGRVGVGIAVREGAVVPDVASVEALRTALLAADAVVFNRASTGVWVEAMLARLGLADTLQPKIIRLPDGAAVMRRLLAGTAPHEIGFGAMTEIALFQAEGVRLAGPLPVALQNETAYVALPWPGTATAEPSRAEAVAALVRFLQGDAARATFAGAGIAVAP